MAFKYIIIAALIACVQSGGPAAYSISALSGDHAYVGSSHENTVKGLYGQNVHSQYHKAVDSAHSSVRVSNSRSSNDVHGYAPHYAGAAYPAAHYAAPAIAHTYAAPAIAHTGYASHAYAAPAYASHGYAAHGLAGHGYAAHGLAAHGYAAHGLAGHAYAAPAIKYAAPAVSYAHASPIAYGHAAAPLAYGHGGYGAYGHGLAAPAYGHGYGAYGHGLAAPAYGHGLAYKAPVAAAVIGGPALHTASFSGHGINYAW